ncbi:MAG: hypothetical protein K0S85_3428 [Pseudomonas orientalis]|nr:hypothetical protein [Pseudomonas orientalis]
MPVCRSELAREKLTGTASIQKARVIVDVFREQARSYKSLKACPLPHLNFAVSGACNFSIAPMTFSFAHPRPPMA